MNTTIPTPSAFTLWYRPDRRSRWEQVGTAATHAGALDLIGTSGRRNGDWLTLAHGKSPGRPKKPTAA